MIRSFRPAIKDDSPKRPEEPSAASAETPRVAEIDESRRKKLREIELKVATYAQKLEAKGASDIAQQCDVFRAKLLEVSDALIANNSTHFITFFLSSWQF